MNKQEAEEYARNLLNKRDKTMTDTNGNTKEKTCEDKVERSLDSRIEDIRILWQADKMGLESVADLEKEDYEDFLQEAMVDYIEPEDFDPEDYGSFNEYGLCFDWVSSDTFKDQEQGFFRYQISYGGPSEEFRFFVDADLVCYRIEFWYLDWFDGAHRTLTSPDKDVMMEIFEMFKECGTLEHLLEEERRSR
jgi:hypothetical protein